MSYFLWIEDFENSPKVTASNVLGGILLDDKLFNEDHRVLKNNLKGQGVFIEFTLQDGLKFITQDVDKKIDYIILDIDLPAYGLDGLNDDVLSLLETFESYRKSDDEAEDEASLKAACNEVKKIAGFYLYTKLVVELGFPKQHILFCSNHGNQTVSITDAFKKAKITDPKIYEKANPYVKTWVNDRFQNPYSRLRRGIIEACRYLKDLSEDRYHFKQFIKEPKKQPSIDDVRDYLEVLANFLPLREPEEPAVLYKLLVRTLAHEWEVADPESIYKQDKKSGLFAFSWIMKMTRNWSAHSKIFEQLEARDVAYLFVVNMRAMFELGDEILPYEKHFLSLFTYIISIDDLKDKIGENARKRDDKNPKGRLLPLIENYAALLDKTGNTWQAINFHDALNNLQKNKDKNIDNEIFIKGLYQAFWFLTSNGRVSIPYDKQQGQIDAEKIRNLSALNYQFNYFDYNKSAFIFELSRHIYHRSFPHREPS